MQVRIVFYSILYDGLFRLGVFGVQMMVSMFFLSIHKIVSRDMEGACPPLIWILRLFPQ